MVEIRYELSYVFQHGTCACLVYHTRLIQTNGRREPLRPIRHLFNWALRKESYTDSRTCITESYVLRYLAYEHSYLWDVFEVSVNP